ncbi:MAG: hypothetical protein AAFP18_08985 [Bacteroidota bacterium]
MTRRTTGIPLLDRTWEGLRPGETYVVTGRAQSGMVLLLRAAQTVAEADESCVYVSGTTPATLAAEAEALRFDIRAATQTQRLRLLRPPTLPAGSDPAEAVEGLARLAQQASPALLVVEDFTPFLGFHDLGMLDEGVRHLVSALHVLPTVLLLGLGAPANDRSAAITQRLCDIVAGSIHVETSGPTDRTLRLRPGTNIALAPATGAWALGASASPLSAPSPSSPSDSPSPVQGVPAQSTPLPDVPTAASSASAEPLRPRGDGYAPANRVGRQVIGRAVPPEDTEAPPSATSSSATSSSAMPPSALPHAPVTDAEPSAPMPSVDELNASLADIFGPPSEASPPQNIVPASEGEASGEPTSRPDAPHQRGGEPHAGVPSSPPAANAPQSPVPEPAFGNASLGNASRDNAGLSNASLSDTAPGSTLPDNTASHDTHALQSEPSVPTSSSSDLDSPMTSPTAPKINALNLAAVAFPVNPHLQPSEFELGGVLMDSWDSTEGGYALGGRGMASGMPGVGSGDGLGQSFTGPPAFDFTGAPEFDARPQPQPQFRPPAPAPPPMPTFASLAQHTFDQSPRGRFAKQVQTAFDRHAATGAPFLALALRMDPSNPFAEAFPLVEDAVREAIDDRDPLYAESDRRRLLALLPERTQSAAAGIYGAIKAQLQLSGGASDAVFTAIAAVTIPNGAPFANARDLMAFAFDTD